MPIAESRVVVAGGSSGIGHATAALLVDQGATVTVTGRSPDKLATAAAEIGARPAAVDATDQGALAALFTELGEIDHLVICVSGAEGAGPFAALDLDRLRQAFEAKTLAQLRVAQAALPHLAERGSITFVTAASARSALAGTAGLAAVNGALEAAVRPLATELAPRRVNAVSPGVVDTAWWSAVPAAEKDALFAATAAKLPVGRVGRPDEIARAIAALIDTEFVTGHVLVVDGGGHLAR